MRDESIQKFVVTLEAEPSIARLLGMFFDTYPNQFSQWSHHSQELVSLDCLITLQDWKGAEKLLANADDAVWRNAVTLAKSKSQHEWLMDTAVRLLRPVARFSRVFGTSGNLVFAARIAEMSMQEIIRTQVASQILEVLDSHLWAKHNVNVLPQATAILKHETGTAAHGSFEFANTVDGKLQLSLDSRQPTPLSFDENQRHWGTKIDLSDNCMLCLYPLSAFRTRVFRCGHALHVDCSPEHACSICYSKRHTSLLANSK